LYHPTFALGEPNFENLHLEEGMCEVKIPADVITNETIDPVLCLVGRFLMEVKIPAHLVEGWLYVKWRNAEHIEWGGLM